MTVGNIQSKTALRLIRKWAQFDIRKNWQKMKAGKPFDIIEPLH